MSSAAMLTHLLLLLSIAAPQVPASRPPGDLFSQMFQRGLVKQKSMKSIRATFTETTVSTLLVKPVVARGTIIAAPPARVRMAYTEPEPKIIVMDAGRLTVLWPRRNEREQIDIRGTQKRIDQYFTNASVNDLRKLFDIRAEPDATIRRADRIEMTPKRKQIRQGLEKLELWIDRENDMLVQMRMAFPGGDEKTIALEDVVLNVPIGDETFQAKP
jgi:outer membrane lipoprotein-sorting protein